MNFTPPSVGVGRMNKLKLLKSFKKNLSKKVEKSRKVAMSEWENFSNHLRATENCYSILWGGG